MALFSNIDWVILVAVAVFLLMGRQAGSVMRTIGRYYGRAVRLKNELLAEITKGAGLPQGQSLRPASIRHALLGEEGLPPASANIPIAVTVPPSVSVSVLSATTGMGGTLGASAWIIAESGPSGPPRGPT